MTRVGFVFSHGINTGPAEREKLPSMVLGDLKKNNIDDLFKIPGSERTGPDGYYMKVAKWDSTGNFMADVVLLATSRAARSKAVSDTADQIEELQGDLLEAMMPGEQTPVLVIVAHSMGEPISITALAKLKREGRAKIPMAIMTIGGPLSNSNPFWVGYFPWCTDNLPMQNTLEALGVNEWVHVINEDDPVCTNWVSRLWGASGWRNPRGSSETIKVSWPGTPGLKNAFAEHSEYFNMPTIYKRLSRMALQLQM